MHTRRGARTRADGRDNKEGEESESVEMGAMDTRMASVDTVS